MERTRFEQLVSNAVAGLPQEFIDKLDNLDIVVEDLPLKLIVLKSASELEDQSRSVSWIGVVEPRR